MTTREEELEHRLTELELRYTHQARQLDELSDVVYQQQQLIDQLRAEVERRPGQDDEIDDPTGAEKIRRLLDRTGSAG